MNTSEKCTIGVIIERRDSDHPWLDHEWVTTGIATSNVTGTDWRLLYSTSGLDRYVSRAIPLELHRAETEAYLYNLESPVPSLFAVLRDDDDDESSGALVPYSVHLVTASPYEAQDYLDSSEEHVDRIALEPELVAWIEHFVLTHHKEEAFKKRRRDKVSLEEHKFGQDPIFDRKRRSGSEGSGELH